MPIGMQFSSSKEAFENESPAIPKLILAGVT